MIKSLTDLHLKSLLKFITSFKSVAYFAKDHVCAYNLCGNEYGFTKAGASA